MKRRTSCSLVVSMACWVTLAASALAQADEPRVPDNIRQLMQDRKYGDAVTAIDALIAKKPDDVEAEKFDRDYLAYLKGRALQLDHQYDEAVKAYDKMNADFPKSDWARRARFAKGVTLARKGDFKAAEAVYRVEAEYLLSEKRKEEIAGIYLEFADAFFSPPKKDEVKPDFQQAL